MLRGTVLLDKRGRTPRWVLRYPDVNGRMKRETTAVSTRQLARRLLAQRNDEVAQARLLQLPTREAFTNPKPPVTVREFAKEYLAHVEANLTPDHAADCRRQWEQHFEKDLGPKLLRDVTPGDLQRFIDRRRRDGRSPGTIRAGLAFMSGLYREAMKAELVDRNPASLLKWPKMESTIVRFLSEKEEASLLAFAPDFFRPAIIVAIHSGLRDGEQRRLTWADVDFEQGAITVRHTKSKRDRIVPMNATLRRTLEALPRHVTCPNVFWCAKTGRGYTHEFNNTTWKKILKRAGISRLRWHDLRHTFASRLAQRGVSLQIIKELLGHSTLQMVLRYAHLQQQNLRNAVAALDSVAGIDRKPLTAVTCDS